jgi:hypothetical protein
MLKGKLKTLKEKLLEKPLAAAPKPKVEKTIKKVKKTK